MDDTGTGPLSPSAAPGPLDGRRPGVQGALDALVLGTVRPLAGVLAILYAGLAVGHHFLSPPEVSAYLMGAAAVTCALLSILWMGLHRWVVSPSGAHPLAAGLAILVLGNSILQLVLTGEPRQTTTFILLVLGVAVLFLDAGWFALVVSAAVASWAMVVVTSPPSPDWTWYGVSLGAAVLLASAVLAIRIRTARGLEQLRRRDRIRQLELESALARTERARVGEVQARRALEGAVAEARESEERFRRLSEATFEGVVIVRGHRIVEANGRMPKLLGVPRERLLGSSFIDWFAPDHREAVTALLRGVVESGSSLSGREVEVLREGAGSFPAELSLAPASHDQSRGAVAVLRDVTEARRLESILRDAAREAEASSRAKSAFLATMSHELRTPLNAVIGFSNVLLRNSQGNLSERELDYLGRILANGKHLLSLIEDILDLSKIEAGRMELVVEPVRVDELVSEVVDSLELQAQRKGIELVAELPDGVGVLMTDRQRLRQVLLNLAGNAVKFTAQGKVTIRVLPGGEGGAPRAIEVADTGIGIPEDQLASIFEPFRQVQDSTARSYGGAGLGLSISRSLCGLMGFGLDVESRPGEGSVFRVSTADGGAPMP